MSYHSRKLLVIQKLVLVVLLTSSAIQSTDAFDHIINALKERNYDKIDHPLKNNGTATFVQTGLHIHSINGIDEKNMQLVLDIYLRQQWLDDRLQGVTNDSISFYGQIIDLFWLPDPYFPEAKKVTVHKVLSQSRSLHLQPSGSVTFNVRLIIELSCHMKFQSYPLDDQLCSLSIESFSLTTSDLMYRWSEDKPISFTEEMQIPKFVLVKPPALSNYTKEVYRAADGSEMNGILVDFLLRREFMYHFIQIYFPSSLVVILSWVSFLIDVGSAPARVSIGLLTVLTITTQSMNANASMPEVSYIKALDIWLTACLTLVILAFLEYAIVSNIFKKHHREVKLHEKQKKQDYKDVAETGNDTFELLENRPSIQMKNATQSEEVLVHSNPPPHELKSYRIDHISRIIFPVVFLVFNLIYWITFVTIRNRNHD